MKELSTPSLPFSPQRQKGRLLKWVIFGAAGLLLLILAGAAWMIYQMSNVPDDLDLSTQLPTSQGLYSVTDEPQPGAIAVNQIHSWKLHVETADGRPVEDAQVRVDGDMPQHGHGLPTRPQVTRYLGDGDYLVEGVKFHMPGWWVMDFEIQAGGKTDTVRFNLMLQ